MQLLDEADPIWGQKATVYLVGRGDRFVKSDRCGNFQAPEGFQTFISTWSPVERAKLSSWILEQNIAGETPTLTPDNLQAARSRRSLSINQKIDRFLQMLVRKEFRPGDRLPWTGVLSYDGPTLKSMHTTMHWIEAVSDSEFFAFANVLQQAGVVELDERTSAARLAYGGYQRMERLDSGSGVGIQAFVAMWFDVSMHSAFEEGFYPALVRAGYLPRRIDQKEHNNKIDDEIVAEIRRSRFIVADFTSGLCEVDDQKVQIARGGVYYEAGLAQGLGLPVIWTVRADQISMVHFDTRQFNHVVWKNPLELQTLLYNRIAATIGLAAVA